MYFLFPAGASTNQAGACATIYNAGIQDKEVAIMSEIIVPHVEPPYPFEAYTHMVEPLSEEDGGGYLITFPDLPGCMSDAKTEGTSLNTLVTMLLAKGIGLGKHRA